MKGTKLPLAVLAVVIMVHGCAAHPVLRVYEGPERPLKDVAALLVSNKLSVKRIDGKKCGFDSWFFGRYEGECHLLPGKHTLTAYLSMSDWVGDETSVSHVFHAGRVYQLYPKIYQGGFLKVGEDRGFLKVGEGGSYYLEIYDTGTIEDFAREYGNIKGMPSHWRRIMKGP